MSIYSLFIILKNLVNFFFRVMRCCFSCSKHVVFGKVVHGMDILKKLEQVGTDGGKPACPVKIVDCGESSENNTYSAVRTEKGALVYFWYA